MSEGVKEEQVPVMTIQELLRALAIAGNMQSELLRKLTERVERLENELNISLKTNHGEVGANPWVGKIYPVPNETI